MKKDTQDMKAARVEHIAIGLFLKKYPRLKAEDWPKDTVLKKEFIADAVDLEWWIRTQATPAPSQDRALTALSDIACCFNDGEEGWGSDYEDIKSNLKILEAALQSPRPRDDGALVEILENLIARLKVISGQGDGHMPTVRALAWDAISMINVFLDAHAKQKGQS